MPREIIDLPVAGTFQQGEYGIGLRIYPDVGALTDFSIGILERLFVVLYYGGGNLIGEGNVNWNPQLGVDFRFRIINEDALLPGIAVGINTQGYGGFIDEKDKPERYAVKSRGMYVVGSRNYAAPLGDFAVHVGANLSLEREDKDKDLNLFAGTNMAIKSIGEVLVEYDSAINDNGEMSVGHNKGYLNIGIRFFVSNNFLVAFYFKNLFENTKDSKSFGREIRIEYRNSFKQ